MKAKPYVGITGPVNVQETKDICREFSKAGYSMGSPHTPMLGFLVSYKTLNGQTTQNRRYPPANSLPELLKATDGRVLTMVHYNSKETDTLSNQVAKIFDGVWNGKGKLNDTFQRAIIYKGKTVILDKNTGQVIDFYEGSELRGLIKLVEVK